MAGLPVGIGERAASSTVLLQVQLSRRARVALPAAQGETGQCIGFGRVWFLHGDHAKALEALNTTRRAAPQQTRYHPMVEETMRSLVRTERRRSETLSSFAAWIGITG